MKITLLFFASIISIQFADSALQDDYFKLSAEDIDGNEVKFDKFKGMVSIRCLLTLLFYFPVESPTAPNT